MYYDILKIEIADTPSKQAQGLMYRKSLSDDSGMLFKFNKPHKLRFWGVNTYIPLDIAFVNPHNRIEDILQISPMSEDIVESRNNCIMAVEANLGYFKNKKISVGDKIEVGDDFIKFIKNNKFAQSIIELNRDQLADLPDDIKQMLEDYHDYDTETMTDAFMQDSPDAGAYFDNLEVDRNISPLNPMDDDGFIFQEDLLSPYPDVPQADESDYPDFMNAEQAMEWAAREGETVRIWYQTLGGRDIERSIEPQFIYNAHTTGNNILVSYDRTIGEHRGFIVGNILYYSFEGDNYDKNIDVSM